MTIFTRMIPSLLLCLGLTACGANSMFETDMEQVDDSAGSTRMAAGKAVVPEGCISWFDGCNTCMVKDGEIGGCTRKACKGDSGEPKCSAFAPGFSDAGAAKASSDVPTNTSDASDEPEPPSTIPEQQRDVTADIPSNCKIWFDGCNSCVVMGGKLRGCTTKSCTTTGAASCTKSD